MSDTTISGVFGNLGGDISIDDLEDRIDASSSCTDEQNTPTNDWTPIERLSVIGEDALDDHVFASDRRTVTLFEH